MKKAVALLCALVLAIGLVVPAFAVDYGAELNPNEKQYTQSFSDVPTNHWAFKYIAELVDRKAINGYPDGRFYPDRIVNREEFSKIMVVAAGLNPTPVYTSSFVDVPVSYWASPFIETAKPYMTAYQSYGGMAFKPTDGALREDMAVAVVMLKGYDARLADVSLLHAMFTDVESISAAAQPYVALAVENGIISGYQDRTFRAQATITRAEAAAILWRAFQYGSDTKVLPGDTTPQPPVEPSAEPSPELSPSPSPSAKPSPSQTPDKPLKSDKPFVSNTIARGVKITDTDKMMTMDDNDNLIYYNANTSEIASLDPVTRIETLLLDTSEATYTTEDGTTYNDMTVDQVFWDDVASRLLVTATFSGMATYEDGGWTGSNGTGITTCSGVFVLTDGVLDRLAGVPVLDELDALFYDYKRLECALSDGTFAICEGNRHSDDDKYDIYDLLMGKIITNLGGASDALVVQKGGGLYKADSGRFGLCNYYKLNYGTSRWDEVGELPRDSVTAYQNGVFYTWNSTEIRATRPEDAATQFKLNPSTDVEILDLRPLPTTPNNLIVTTGEQYIFYDSSANAIRVIEANPDAR